MKVNNISKVINRLLDTNLQAILISGVWGIGKTYTVKQFMKEQKQGSKKKKVRIGYSSLFGKNSVDEINTELYQLFNPKKKIIHVITNVAKLVNIGVGLSCGISLDVNEDKIKTSTKIKKHKKIKQLIILDDFERKSDKISSEDILGYINNLINQGFKIVVLADLETKYGLKKQKHEISKIEKETLEYRVSKLNLGHNILGDYKEKIFDRIYNITETPHEVIESIFKDNQQLLNLNLLNEFDNNIRMAIKANSLFMQIKDYVGSKGYKDVDYRKIIKICIYAVKELMTNKYSNEYEEIRKNSNFIFWDNSFAGVIKSYDKSLNNDNELIEAINSIYLNEDYQKLDEIYNPNEEKNIFKSCFYLSDDEKVDTIKKQYNYIMNLTNDSVYSSSSIAQLIREWYCYAGFLDLPFICQNELFKKLYSLDVKLDNIYRGNTKCDEIINNYIAFCDSQKGCKIIDLLKDKDDEKIKLGLSLLQYEYNNLNEESKVNVEDLLKENDFLLKPLDKHISESSWDFNHMVCDVVCLTIPSLTSDLLICLEKIKSAHNNDLSCADRVNTLINLYKLR